MPAKEPATATFAVHAPGVVPFTSARLMAQVDPNTGILSLGPPTSDGFTGTANVTVSADETGANIGFIELINTLRTFVGSNEQKSSNNSFVLDLPPNVPSPFVAGSVTPIPASNGETFPFTVVDTPLLQAAPPDTHITADDKFQMYLMYQPPGQGSIFVTIGELNWSWKASATKAGGSWSLDPNPVNPGNPDGAANSTLPTWTQVVTGLVYTPLAQ